ncbi:MAG: c-type cytochrome [Terracidiphilus sp.]
MVRIVFGMILALILAPLVLLAWLRLGHVPVAVADSPFPMERPITQMALNARIDREMPGNPPIQPDETNLTAGAEVYRDQCAACHGFYGKPSSFGPHMYPSAPALWQKHKNGDVVGVSDDPPGETWWKVTNGIRLTGMPAFKATLSDTQVWQVTLLLANANKPLPPTALAIVRGEQPAAPVAVAPPAASH